MYKSTKYNFPFVKKNASKSFIYAIEKGANRLIKKLVELDIQQLPISEYNRQYIKSFLKSPIGHIQKFSYLLCLGLGSCNARLSDLTIIDYGGGSGIMSLLAKEMGIGKVIYNDIYDVSCDDIEITAKRLDLKLDHIVCGGIECLISHIQEHDLRVDAIVSYDVIEHIYNIYDFFADLQRINKSPFYISLGSGANPKNRRICNELSLKQQEIDRNDRKETLGNKERDSLKSYYTIRTEIIKAHLPNLKSEEVQNLATQTRGMIEKDIIDYINYYNKDNFIERVPNGSNTCDPYTGNWAEHLLDFNKILQITKNNNINARIIPGYLPYSFLSLRRFKRNIINVIISVFPSVGIRFSPFYIVHGQRTI